MIREISPIAEYDTGCRIHGLFLTKGEHLVAKGHGGKYFVFRDDLNLEQQFVVGNGSGFREHMVPPLALDNQHDLFIKCETEKFQVWSIAGQLLHEETTPLFQGQGFDSYLFSEDEKTLWLVRHVRNGQVEIQLRNTTTWDVVRLTQVEEPVQLTSFSLSMHPEKKVLVIWAAAGQDGQWVYWAFDDGEQIRIRQVEPLVETTPPEFHPSGAEFLVIRDDCLCRFSFPDNQDLGVLEWPFYTDDDPDNRLGYNVCYLSDEMALVSTQLGRLFMVDLSLMQVLEELHIQGHEPMPLEQLFPVLAGETDLATDLQFFSRLWRGRIVSVHHLRDSGTDDRHWRDSLVLWGGSWCGNFKRAEPDPTAPYSRQMFESFRVSE